MPIPEFDFFDPDGSRIRVADDMGQDWVRDTIHRADQLDLLRAEPNRLVRFFDEGISPVRGLPVPVPKSGLTIRPATNLKLIDRVAYQALIDLFAFEVMADMPPFVCGWCYATGPSSPDDLLDNSLEWRRYEALLETEWNVGAKYVLATDIAGFFQSVPHRLLRERLAGVDGEIVNTLMDYLRIWNPTTIGVPQRVLGSSLLANIYLEAVDEVLSDYRSIRWMDDILVFCDSRREGIEAILRIQDALHPLGLVLNANKTFLLPYDEASSLVEFIRHRVLEYQLRTGDPSGEIGLAEAWQEALKEPELADRTRFSFCVTRFAEQENDEPGEIILENLGRLPHVSDHVSRYLRTLLSDSETLEHITRFLKGYNNQFVWQEYRLATLFWHAERLSDDTLEFVRRRSKSRNTYWAARSVYLRAIAKHGTKADAHTIRDSAEDETNPEVLRAMIIGAAESGHVPPAQLKRMARAEPEMDVLIRYLLGRDLTVPPISY